MKYRVVASVAIAAALLLGTTACNFISPQRSTEKYDASDGISETIDGLDIRNALLVSQNGEQATVVLAVVNPSDKDRVLNLSYTTSSGDAEKKIDVSANSTVSLGSSDDSTNLVLTNIDAPAGSLFTVYFQTSSAPGKKVGLPVLDGSQSAYSGLIPPTPTPTFTNQPVPVPIPTSTTVVPVPVATETTGTNTDNSDAG